MLLEWSESRIAFNVPTALDNDASLMLDRIRNHRRKVPIPRRMLRCLARRGNRALIATVFAHLLRGLYLRGRGVNPRGTCKASWIADVFGVHHRTIKAARSRLVRSGWLKPQQVEQWRMNRFGAAFEINLEWGRGRLKKGRTARVPLTDSPPPMRQPATGSPPPLLNQKLPSELNNQKPARRGPAGVCDSGTKNSRPPTLRSLKPHDLTSAERLDELFYQAVRQGHSPAGEAARLQFFSAAQHAQSVGTRNPCGLFAWLLRTQSFHHVTLADEERARGLMAQRRECRSRPFNSHFRATRPPQTQNSRPESIRSTMAACDWFGVIHRKAAGEESLR